jgi:hypothetical protein
MSPHDPLIREGIEMDIRTTKENMDLLKQKRVRKAIVVFFLFMLIMTFLSKTLNNLSLPRVDAVKPSAGYLVREIRGYGIIEPVEVFEIYPGKNVKVTEILVKSGSYVSKGGKIVETDITEAEKIYAKSMLRYENAKLDYQKLQLHQRSRIWIARQPDRQAFHVLPCFQPYRYNGDEKDAQCKDNIHGLQVCRHERDGICLRELLH